MGSRPMRLHARRAACALGVLLAALHAATAEAQVVRGRVTDAATGLPVAGAWVTVAGASRTAGTLTNVNGAFLLPGLPAGRFTLRAEMIGRRSVERTLDLAARDTVDLDLALPPTPVSLAGIDVTAARRCEVRPGAGSETSAVWEEARKALAVESALRTENAFRFSIQRFVREMDPSRSRVIREDAHYVSRFTGTPFRTMPADYLAERGFIESRPDGTYLFGPNAEVLLSDAFLDTHCMYLRRDTGRPGSIALAFEPVPGRNVADIRGELWLDERTAELRSLDFGYTGLPSSMAPGDYGGAATFLRLAGGGWIVRDWQIRSPIIQLAPGTGRGLHTAGYRIEGAEVVAVHYQDGRVLYASGRTTTEDAGRRAGDARISASGSETAEAVQDSADPARSLELRGFFERMRSGPPGLFLTREEIEKRGVALLTDLFADLPGVRSLPLEAARPGGAEGTGPHRTVRFLTRTDGSASATECEPALLIDGVRSPRPANTDRAGTADFDAVPVARVEGLEVYLGALAPAGFRDAEGCGVVVVWTRGR